MHVLLLVGVVAHGHLVLRNKITWEGCWVGTRPDLQQLHSISCVSVQNDVGLPAATASATPRGHSP